MKPRHPVRTGALLSCLAFAALASCFDPTLSLRDGQTLIDSAGGVLATDAGARVDVPAGAVLAPTAFTFRAAQPSLPSSWRSAGPAWLARPEGTQFEKPVTVTLPVSAPDGDEVRVATARQGSDQFELLASTRSGATVSAQVSHFSIFVPVVVARGDAGAPDPDPDAGAAEAPDASKPLVCEAPDTGYCIAPVALFPMETCLFKSPCSDYAKTREVRCSGSTCTCRLELTEWTVPWFGDCSFDAYRDVWTCDCGFPVLLDVPPCPDAGLPPGSGLPLASACVRDSECASGYCFGTYSLCTLHCDDATPCPCGFACRKDVGVCLSLAW